MSIDAITKTLGILERCCSSLKTFASGAMIVPYPAAASASEDSLAPTPTKLQDKAAKCSQKLLKWWSSLHMSYRGCKYSVERLIALDEYVRRTSVVRVVCICVSAPACLALAVLGLELIPAQDPSAGWAGNYGFWIRVAIFSMVIANAFLVQAKNFIQGCSISPRQLFLIVLFAAVLETPLSLLVAVFTWFPVPFSILTMAPTFYPILLSLFCIFVPRDVIREMLTHPDQVIRYLKFTAALQLMAVVYPVYQTLFQYAHDTEFEILVLMLLPVIKLIMKNVILRSVTHMEDMMPEAVIFTADFFNALYMSTSMETASSTSAVLIVVLIDGIQAAFVLYPLNHRTNDILERLNEASVQSGDLPRAAFHLCRNIEKFTTQKRSRIQIRSCLPHCISREGRDLLGQLETIPCRGVADSLRRHTSPAPVETLSRTNVWLERRQKLSKASTWRDRRRPTIVTPAKTAIIPSLTTMDKKVTLTDTQHTQSLILREALEVLFTTECLLLNASLDVVVPLFYGTFLLVMVRLPNGKYHTELTGITSDNIGGLVDSVFIFALVEAVSFGLLVVLIYRNLGINALYHVAFVLETQRELIQAKLLTWVLMTMAFRVVHFGIDFSFQFAWLSN